MKNISPEKFLVSSKINLKEVPTGYDLKASEKKN